MGYCIEMTDSNFIIRKENFDKALESLKSIFLVGNMTCKDYVCGNIIPHFRWINTQTVLESKSLKDALIEIRYKPKFNKSGDIMNVKFTGEKYGDEDIFFHALAPYVESGSYIDFEGEDEATWKWLFENGEVTQE